MHPVSTIARAAMPYFTPNMQSLLCAARCLTITVEVRGKFTAKNAAEIVRGEELGLKEF
jgi:hypothetical protein